MSEEAATDPKFEIGHVLFIDIVGYSKLLIGEQSELIRHLKEVVAGSEQVRLGEEQGKLVSLPTGDGVALVFRDSAEAPAQCGLEIAQAVNRYPQLRLRMGIHSGPVNMVTDVNNRANVAGAGINIAQRVMDCGDAGHILLSKHVAEDLEHYARWRPYLHELGECEVKHGVRISLVNFYGSNFGNAEIPEKIRQAKREQARASRDRRKTILVATSIVAAAMLGIGYWVFHQRRANDFGASETKQAVATMSEQMARLHEGIMQYMQVEGKIREAQTESGSVRDQVYEQLGKQMNIGVALLRQKLPQAAEQLKDAPSATLFERANAAYVASDYAEAERMALQAAAQARTAMSPNNADVIRALKLAGFAAQKRIDYASAMTHFREAAGLTDRKRDPAQWAEIQHAVADVLIDQGQYREAATVLQHVIETRTSAFGPEHPNTLRSRNRLAYALWREGRYRDSETEFRKLIAVEERVLGAQDPETLASKNGLANALDDEGRHGDAESEHRRVLDLRSKVLGPENPETLKSRNNLALALNREQKYAEAEKQFRELITIEERVLGREHPETLRGRRNLFVTLGNQGRHEEAEAGFRDLLAIEERVLGPEHPDTLGVRNNIGFALAQRRRFADAEPQFREVIRTEAKVLGPEHPSTLSSRMALAGVLSQEQKYTEADAECREVIALEEKVLGTDHPSTISSWYAFAYQLARQNKNEEALQFARRAASAAEQALGRDHPDTRKYTELVQELDSQRPGADQTSVKPLKAGVNEYIAAEAGKHIGETATVVGKVECIGAGRTYHYLELDACMPNSPFWIIVNDNASGPDLNIQDLKGVTIAATGKIERPDTQPWLVVKSTTQIQARSQRSTPKDVSIIVVRSPSEGRKTGNVKVTFTDRRTQVLTHTGDCFDAKVSPNGNVGWIQSAKMEHLTDNEGVTYPKMVAVNKDSLVVRLLDGKTRKFPPLGENTFIVDWRFGDDDKTVILRSAGYHGPSSFVQYDLASGKVIDSRGNGYTPYAELPAWAKPLADDLRD